NTTVGQSRFACKEQVPGVLAAVLDDVVHRLGEAGVAADRLLADLELLRESFRRRLLVRLTRSAVKVRPGPLAFNLQIPLAPEITFRSRREVSPAQLLVDDVTLDLVPVGELLLGDREGIALFPAVADAVVSVYQRLVTLPDDEGVATPFGVEASLEV